MVRKTSRRSFLWETAAFGVGLTLFDSWALAQEPVRLLTYQGRLVDGAGVAESGTFSMAFRLVDGAGNSLGWAETHPAVTVQQGFFTVQLGSSTPLSATLFEGPPTDAFGPVRMLEVTVEGEVLSPNLRLTSAAWVLTGAVGPQGASGAQGLQGFQATQGAQGFQGTSGAQGFQGFQATQGAQGFQGNSGGQGFQGFQGTSGGQGFQGGQGNSGPQGFQGVLGTPGAQGFQGFQGAVGQGAQGLVL
jgi:Collagen triple helix repeat (20 copies)